jgi:hypothetical protein
MAQETPYTARYLQINEQVHGIITHSLRSSIQGTVEESGLAAVCLEGAVGAERAAKERIRLDENFRFAGCL